MSGEPVMDCLVCQEHAGLVEVPGGYLIDDDTIVAFHCPPLAEAPEPYLGHLLVTPRRHVPSFAELGEEEASRVGVAIAVLSAALTRDGAERVYVATVGHGVPHLHVHLLPRWPDTPSDVPWYQVDEWDGASRGDAGSVAATTARLRSLLSGGP